tara:strand:+ start:254 stop:973 length:720 start_codon:yes stop_codon:yes gene_type:complete
MLTKIERLISRSLLTIFLSVIVFYLVFETLDSIDQNVGTLRPFESLFSVGSNFFLGICISFLFYYLVVVVPENRRREAIKSNLSFQYKRIKEDILYQVIFASQQGGRNDLTADTETLEKLSTVQGFRDAFVGGREADEGFYAFRNHMSADVPEFREIIFGFKMLAEQIDFVMHNYPIADPEIFRVLNNLKHAFRHIEFSGPGYDEEKAVSKLIWEIFGGSNWVDGPRDYDLIERMITDV